MIRQALLSEVKECLMLTKAFYGDFMLSHDIKMVDDDLEKTVKYFIDSGQNLVIERDNKIVGIAAWALSAHPANSKCRVFQEVLWCCASPIKTDALCLLRELEHKAEEAKADIIVLANLSLENEPALRRIYEAKGYKYMESHYAKTLYYQEG